MRRLLPTLVCSFVLAFPLIVHAESSEYGVLILANGGPSHWKDIIKKTVKEAKIPQPHRVFYGQGATRDEISQLQDDINYLEDKGVHTIIAIPLLTSSYSDVCRQWRYLLGVDIKPGFINNPVFPLEKHANVQFVDTLNDDPISALVLLDRAREISQNPDDESVLVVTQGAKDDADNDRWLMILSHLADDIRQHGHFRSVEGLALRDDARPEVRQQAYDSLRARVEEINHYGGRVLIVPMVISPDGIDNRIGIALKGLEYTLNGRQLLPDNRIPQWVRSKVP